MIKALDVLLRMMLAYYGQRILAQILDYWNQNLTAHMPGVPEAPLQPGAFEGFGGGEFQPLEDRDFDEDLDGYIWDQPCGGELRPRETHHGAGGRF